MLSSPPKAAPSVPSPLAYVEEDEPMRFPSPPIPPFKEKIPPSEKLTNSAILSFRQIRKRHAFTSTERRHRYALLQYYLKLEKQHPLLIRLMHMNRKISSSKDWLVIYSFLFANEIC